MFHTNASASNAEPSWNFTSFLSVKIHVVGSFGSCFQLVARPGRIVAGTSAFVRSHRISPSNTGYPRNRIPSNPLFGIPVVVGMSPAVIATRGVPCEGPVVEIQKTNPDTTAAANARRNMADPP